MPTPSNSYSYSQPDANGYFGDFGGVYIAETLHQSVLQLAQSYNQVKQDPAFHQELQTTLQHYVGRPSPIYHAKRLSQAYGGAAIYLKREDLNHTGSHKINNTVGQIILAKHLNKNRIIAETGAGQHGVATATVCARENLQCVVYMGAEDIDRQRPNVERMQLLGATVQAVHSGTQTLKDALNEALRDWVTNVDNTFYVIGSVAGPHPYPMMVRDFNSVIGNEAFLQMQDTYQRQPNAVIACVGGGSNAMGIFYRYINQPDVDLIGVEAGGHNAQIGNNAAPLSNGSPGVLHGAYSYLLQTPDGQISHTSSISAGLDYPGVGPEHAHLKDSGRAQYVSVEDEEALAAFDDLCRYEGIIPALESAHAIAQAKKEAKKRGANQAILVNLSGRGDKDVQTVLNLKRQQASQV